MTDLGIAEPEWVLPLVMPTPKWTVERLALLRIALAEGRSNGDIAKQLGTTRNAVCGKVFRARYEHLRPEKPVVPKPRRLRAPRPQPARKHLAPTFSAVPDAIAEYHERRRPYGVQLVDLTHFHCRFPVGDPQKPDFFFCAAPTTSTYCQIHQEHCHEARTRFYR